VLVGRVVPVVRGYISFPAGIARVPILSFSMLTLAGSLPWCAALAAAGYVLGENYRQVSGPLGTAASVVGVLVVVLLGVWFIRGRSAPLRRD
jgi:membrane protein DedA with SNARE-associated domain